MSAPQTALEVAIEYAQNDLASMEACELQGIPAHLDEDDVKAALRDLEVVSAAELTRLRNVARLVSVLLAALDAHEDASEESDCIDYHADAVEMIYENKAAIHAALSS